MAQLFIDKMTTRLENGENLEMLYEVYGKTKKHRILIFESYLDYISNK